MIRFYRSHGEICLGIQVLQAVPASTEESIIAQTQSHKNRK